jgi:hypothetical protein
MSTAQASVTRDAEPAPAFREAPENLDRTVHWKNAQDVGMLQAFINKPPFRSVRIKFSPAAAEQVLKLCNEENRPLAGTNMRALRKAMKDESFDLTGDTIKFDKNGRLLDGQHRLEACVKEDHDLESHVVFGLDTDVFEVLDQGRKRTPGDILAIARFGKDSMQLASATRWADALVRGDNPKNVSLSSRRIVQLLRKEYADLKNWLAQGRIVNDAFRNSKHPPSMIAALLYTIARQDKPLAERFAQEWVHGARLAGTINKNFDTLQKKLTDLTNEQGKPSAYVNAALVIQMFNAWNAGVVLAPRDLHWKPTFRFPRVHINADDYRAEVEARSLFSEMTGNQSMVYVALETKMEADGRVRVSQAEIETLTDIKPSPVALALKQLAERGHITVIKEGEKRTDESVYRLSKSKGKA